MVSHDQPGMVQTRHGFCCRCMPFSLWGWAVSQPSIISIPSFQRIFVGGWDDVHVNEIELLAVHFSTKFEIVSIY